MILVKGVPIAEVAPLAATDMSEVEVPEAVDTGKMP